MRLNVYADGACWGNPGPAAIGAVIKDHSFKILVEISKHIGIGTNNQAEYKAIIAALIQAKAFGASEVTVYLDSELVIRQLNGRYRVKNINLKPLHDELVQLSKGFLNFNLVQITHSDNKEAHHLAQSALANSKQNKS